VKATYEAADDGGWDDDERPIDDVLEDVVADEDDGRLVTIDDEDTDDYAPFYADHDAFQDPDEDDALDERDDDFE